MNFAIVIVGTKRIISLKIAQKNLLSFEKLYQFSLNTCLFTAWVVFLASPTLWVISALNFYDGSVKEKLKKKKKKNTKQKKNKQKLNIILYLEL